MNKSISAESFEKDPVSRIVIKNALPAIIAMVMVMVYNLADIFFIGLTKNDFQVAAVSLASPVFMIFMSIGTLFGVGGTSVISRALGSGDEKRMKHTSAFCTWCSVGVGAVLMGIMWGFSTPLALMLGASADTLDFTLSYLRITVSCGVFTMFSVCSSNTIRAEGKPMAAMTGTVVGNLLNLILDPIFILGFRWGITGAAIATVIGNVAGAMYYLIYFLRKKSVLSLNPKDFSGKNGIAKDVIAIGLSASLANLLSSLSSILANKALSDYGDLYVAGYGVSSKVLLIVYLIGIGMGAGVQPVFGYYYGSENKKRLTEALRFATLFGLGLCLLLAVLCFIFAGPMVNLFLTTDSAYGSGVLFTRILMSTAWLMGAFVIWTNALQSMGAAFPALLACLFRQGILFIIALYALKALFGMEGIIWAQPAADVLSIGIIFFMLQNKLRKAKLG